MNFLTRVHGDYNRQIKIWHSWLKCTVYPLLHYHKFVNYKWLVVGQICIGVTFLTVRLIFVTLFFQSIFGRDHTDAFLHEKLSKVSKWSELPAWTL